MRGILYCLKLHALCVFDKKGYTIFLHEAHCQKARNMTDVRAQIKMCSGGNTVVNKSVYSVKVTGYFIVCVMGHIRLNRLSVCLTCCILHHLLSIILGIIK